MRAIGRCAVTLERAAERCINVLLDLIKQKVNYVVQEAVVVITDIFRRYPNRCALVLHLTAMLRMRGEAHPGVSPICCLARCRCVRGHSPGWRARVQRKAEAVLPCHGQ